MLNVHAIYDMQNRKPMYPIVCSKETEMVYIDDNEIIHINYSRVNSKHVNCSYQEIIRKIENDNEIRFGDPIWFENATLVKSDSPIFV
jgi:hypothetical protein